MKGWERRKLLRLREVGISYERIARPKAKRMGQPKKKYLNYEGVFALTHNQFGI